MREALVVAILMASAAASYFAIRSYLQFALEKQILDIPNERSSHAIPTPRGAGLAFATVFLVSVALLGLTGLLLFQELLALMAGAMVAAVGYWDDRSSLNIRTRLFVQLLAASIVVASLSMFHVPGRQSSSMYVMAALICVEILGITWLLNLTNFMDGIDGIVAMEVVTVTAVCAGLILFERGVTVPALLFAMLGVTVAPFLLFNWAPAKIFMGDVGSCFIGFTLGVLSLIAVAHHQLSLFSPIILLAVFISDATITLVTRIVTRQRWYLPHRTHAFQILARRHGHKRVAGSVGILNLVWLAPLAIAAEYDQAHGIFYVVTAFAPLLITCRILAVGNPKSAFDTIRPSLRQSDATGLWGSASSFLHRSFPALQLGAMALLSVVCVAAALRLHYDGSISTEARATLFQVVLLWSTCQCVVLACLRLHRRHWRFTSVEEFPTLIGISLLGSTFGGICAWMFARMHGIILPPPAYLLEAVLSVLAFTGLRVFLRQFSDLSKRLIQKSEREPVLICNADVAGIGMLSEIRLHFPEYRPIGFIDERSEVRGLSICGLRVLGRREDLKRIVRKHSIHHVFISQSLQSKAAIEATRDICVAENIDLHVVASFANSDNSKWRAPHQIGITDLFGRAPIVIDRAGVLLALQGRVVMVTGAAGSIGSELCREIAAFHPSAIVTYDINETALFSLERELQERFSSIRFIPCIGSIQNFQGVSEVISAYRPTLVFHAAAYKHAPLMERQMFQAVENNVLGTEILLRACRMHGVETFAMVSTESASRPTSLMGATKRAAEVIVRSNASSDLKCISVRLGKVLENEIVPNFRTQIASGGPVTVPHPSEMRSLMTVSEAAQLVLQTSIIDDSNAIYALAPTESVPLADLAERMIRLMGSGSGRQVAVKFTGIREIDAPEEDLLTSFDDSLPTSHPNIFTSPASGLRNRDVPAEVRGLKAAVDSRNAAELMRSLQSLVPEYLPGKDLLNAVEAWDGASAQADLSVVPALGRV